jgi:hypothetical protein
MRDSKMIVLAAATAFAVACGGGGGAQQGAATPKKAQNERCGDSERVEEYDLYDEDGQDLFSPCAATGNEDFSGKVHIDTTPEGILVTISATDDDFNEGKVGTPVTGRDAVIVYPKGPEAKGIEVPLEPVPGGFKGSKLIPFEELDKLTDEGTKLTIRIHDDDHRKGAADEELKVQVTVSAGKSCERAIDENPQEIRMGAGQTKDLTTEQLGEPMKSSAFMSSCDLPDSATAEICAAVKNGKPLGVSVNTSPKNNKVAACIDRAVRKLSFPKSEKLDVVKTTF